MESQRIPTEGKALPPLEVGPIKYENVKAFAQASGDYNPIHLDKEAAQKFGLPDVIVHGMFIMSFMDKVFTPFVEQGGYLQSIKTRFKSKVFIGDCLQVVAVRIASQADTYKFNIQVFNQHHIEVAGGTCHLKAGGR